MRVYKVLLLYSSITLNQSCLSLSGTRWCRCERQKKDFFQLFLENCRKIFFLLFLKKWKKFLEFCRSHLHHRTCRGFSCLEKHVGRHFFIIGSENVGSQSSVLSPIAIMEFERMLRYITSIISESPSAAGVQCEGLSSVAIIQQYHT